jgi:hypothetical protein
MNFKKNCKIDKNSDVKSDISHVTSVPYNHQSIVNAVSDVISKHYVRKYPDSLGSEVKQHPVKYTVPLKSEPIAEQSEIVPVTGKSVKLDTVECTSNRSKQYGISNVSDSEAQIIPSYLFDENSPDPCIVRIIQLDSERVEDPCYCNHVVRKGEKDRVSAVLDTAITGEHRSTPNVKFLDPSHESIRPAQKADDVIKQVYSWVERGEKPKSVQANRLPQELLSYWKQFSLLKIEN